MAKVSATKRFQTIFPTLEDQWGEREPYKERPPLQQILITLLLVDGKEGPAEKTLERLREHFVDLNELRVSNPDQLDELLGDRHPPGVGKQIVDALTGIFNNTQTMTLKWLMELDADEAFEELSQLEKFPSRAIGELLMACFSYDKLPATEGLLRVAERTDIVSPGAPESQALSLRRITPKDDRARIFHAFEMHAERICTRKDYDCPNCPVKDHCPTGQETLERLRLQEEQEQAAQQAEAARLKRKLERDKRTEKRREEATAKFKETITARSKELNIAVNEKNNKSSKGKKTGKKKSRARSSKNTAKMVQAPSHEVKSKPEKKKSSRKAGGQSKSKKSTKKSGNSSPKKKGNR